MITQFLLLYVAMYALLILLAAYLFYKLSADVTTHYAFLFFRYLIVSYIIYTATNVLCTLGEFEAVKYPHWLFALLVYLTNFFCTVCYSQLYMLSIVRFHPEYFKKRFFQILSFIPTAIVWITMLVSVFTGCMIVITPDNHFVYGPLSIMLPLIGLFYFAVIIAFSIVSYIREPSYVMRNKLLGTIFSVVFIVFWALIDSMYRNTAILPAAFIVSIVFLFINIQEANIYTDFLTKMNNRRKANEYLEDNVKRLSDGRPMYLYMCDIDFFKKINDTFGHSEGDEALIVVANVLMDAAGKFHGFAARYGGDEFIVCCYPQSDDEDIAFSPEMLISFVADGIAEACNNRNTPYSLTISMGYAVCSKSEVPFTSYIREADNMLYRKKAIVHRRGA